MGMLVIEVIGNATRDCEIKETRRGSVAEVRLGVDHPNKNDTRVHFVQLSIWKDYDDLPSGISKGALVRAEGRCWPKAYVDGNRQSQVSLNINARRISVWSQEENGWVALLGRPWESKNDGD